MGGSFRSTIATPFMPAISPTCSSTRFWPAFSFISRARKAAFRFIDTHAGAGRFDLASKEAKRSPEWRDGIARILTSSPPAPVAELLRPYLEAVGPHDAEGRPLSYPGSPAIAQTLMRAQDRIALCEANPDEREALIAALGRDGRLSIVGTDGYVALNAYLPPKERRGIVLIDPPFEAPDEAAAVERALERGFTQMAVRDLHRLATDPRNSSRRPLSQLDRGAWRAQHPAARTRRRLRANRRTRPAAARARRTSGGQSAAYAHGRSADAHAVARANTGSWRRRTAPLRLADGAEISSWATRLPVSSPSVYV